VVSRYLRVFCPMLGATAPVERCIDCSMCDGFDPKAGAPGRPLVRCACQTATLVGDDLVAGAVLARFATAIRLDAVNAALTTPVRSAPIPVVNEDLHMVGVLQPDRQVRLDEGGHALAVDEQETVYGALSRLARRQLRRAPVVARNGTLVGVLEDLDALRALGTANRR
jgi:hypothetical protein